MHFLPEPKYILVNQSNTNFGIAFKHEGLGDGLCSSCTSYVVWEPEIMIAFIVNKPCLGKGFQKSFAREPKFGIFSAASLFGPFGLNATTMCSIMNNGTSLVRSNTTCGTNSSFTLRRHGSGLFSTSRLIVSLSWLCSMALTKLRVLGIYYVRRTIYILNGTGNMCRLSNPFAEGALGGLEVVLGRWGGGGSGGLSLVGSVGANFLWWCFVSEGPRLPSIWAHFLGSF